MSFAQIIFLIVGLVTLGSALMVVIARNLVHAAFWLVVTLFSVAILFALLDANFLAVAQVVIYIGAIAILFIFAVMLTRRELLDRGSQLNPAWWASALIAALTFAGLFFLLKSWSGFSTTAVSLPSGFDSMAELGEALLTPNAFVLPFEVASVLLLAALIGAVYVAFDHK